MTLMLVSCSSPKYLGSWTLSQVNGMTVADYVSQFDVNVADFEENFFDMNLEVTKEEVTVTTKTETSTLKIIPKSDGFETTLYDQVAFSVSYNEETDTLSYTVNLGDEGKVTYTYSRK